jgi:hypothetical protein
VDHHHVRYEVKAIYIFLNEVPIPFIIELGICRSRSERHIDIGIIGMMEGILIADVVQDVRRTELLLQSRHRCQAHRT